MKTLVKVTLQPFTIFHHSLQMKYMRFLWKSERRNADEAISEKCSLLFYRNSFTLRKDKYGILSILLGKSEGWYQ